jgi:hypothetical protein
VSIQVSWDGYITVSSYDLSDHCIQLVVNDGEETRDVTAMGDTSRRFRAGMGTASIEATFWSDHSTTSVEQVLRAHLLNDNTPSTKTPATSPTAALAGSTGNLAVGAYRYWVTFTYPAFETSPSTYASVTVASTTDSQVSLTAIPVPTDWFATGKNIYRTQIAGGGSTTGVLLASLASAATTYVDNASSSSLVGNTPVSSLWQPTGFDVVARKHNTAASSGNPEWTLTAIIDGDLNTLDEKPGEVSQMKVMFRAFNAFTMGTS